MDLLSGLTDDQTALLGCAVSLAVCGLLMVLSYYVGQVRRRQPQESALPTTLRLSEMHAAQPSAVRPQVTAVAELKRRAA